MINSSRVCAAMILAASSAFAGADPSKVAFPESFEQGLHDGTVNLGNIREELYTGRAAIEAVKAGKPLPGGTVITLVDSLIQRRKLAAIAELR